MRIWAVALLLASLASAQTAPVGDREVSWKQMLPNLLEDQQRIWTFPARLAQGHDWIPTVAFAGTTAGLIAGADPPLDHYFRNATSFGGFNRIFTSNATAIGTALVPASLYGVGLLRNDEKMKSTALFATESVVDAEILATVLKKATDRLRPADLPPSSRFGDTWSEAGNRWTTNRGSFPSGHTIAAFSIATVIARRYGDHRWVPFVAYGLAGAVGFSRLTLSAHSASDVFAGAALGFSISQFVVLRKHSR
ncbi:MAG: phosphatase PAP2 family protein [Bryobacteraceae bacterium]